MSQTHVQLKRASPVQLFLNLFPYLKRATCPKVHKEDSSFPIFQGLLQNVRILFDTTVEDVLLSRDCEVPKQG